MQPCTEAWAASWRPMQYETASLSALPVQAQLETASMHLPAHELQAVAKAADDARKDRPVAVLPVGQVLPDGRLWRAQHRVVQEDDVEDAAQPQAWESEQHCGSVCVL